MVTTILGKLYENTVLLFEASEKAGRVEKIINKLVTNSQGRLELQQAVKSKGEIRLKPTSKENKIDGVEVANLFDRSDLTVVRSIPPGTPEAISSKYTTWLVRDDTGEYKVVFAGGLFGNTGLHREMELASETKEAIEKGEDTPLLDALGEAGAFEEFDEEDFPKDAHQEPGKTEKRPLSLELKDIGEKISDITVEMNSGKKIFVSLKATNGSTFANVGIAEVFELKEKEVIFHEDTKHAEMLEAFGVDLPLVIEGINAYLNKTAGVEQKIVTLPMVDHSKILKYIRSGFGYGYWYVREKKKDDFEVKDLTTLSKLERFVDDVQVTEIRYPYYQEEGKCSKQCEVRITVKGSLGTMVIFAQIRNTKGGVVPTQMNLIIKKKLNES